MTYKEFIIALKLEVLNKLVVMQEYIRRKVEDEANMNAETFEGDSQMIDISYKNWKEADLQLHNLLHYITNCGIDLEEQIPEYHKTFPFGEINLN